MDRLALDKEALDGQPENRLSELFEMEYNRLLYDVTSTFFDGHSD